MTDAATRVLFVDDNSGLLESLRLRFELEPDLACVGMLSTAEGLLEIVARTKPDVVVLDVEMPGPDPFAAAASVAPPATGSRPLFLSAYVRDEYIARAVEAGAWGYVGKSEDVDVIIACIRKVAQGGFTLSPRAPEALPDRAGSAVSRAGDSTLFSPGAIAARSPARDDGIRSPDEAPDEVAPAGR